MRRRAFSTPRNNSESKLIPIDEFRDTRWALPHEGKITKDYTCTVQAKKAKARLCEFASADRSSDDSG